MPAGGLGLPPRAPHVPAQAPSQAAEADADALRHVAASGGSFSRYARLGLKNWTSEQPSWRTLQGLDARTYGVADRL